MHLGYSLSKLRKSQKVPALHFDPYEVNTSREQNLGY